MIFFVNVRLMVNCIFHISTCVLAVYTRQTIHTTHTILLIANTTFQEPKYARETLEPITTATRGRAVARLNFSVAVNETRRKEREENRNAEKHTRRR